ncbi:hypothetical protein AUTU_00890 [Aureibacter tunicatorum]|nr:hypothetical protein AUTU_00890 [Aureibacter tunicatorum]
MAIFACVGAGKANAQFVDIPDGVFEQKLIDLGYDDVKDGKVLASNIANVTELDLSNEEDATDEEKISDLTGISGFNSLAILKFNYNNVETLDLENMRNLKEVYGNYNKLESIENLDDAVDLEKLYLTNNSKLTELDVTKNLKLTHLYINDTKIFRLDLLENTELVSLECVNTILHYLDLSSNQKLSHCRVPEDTWFQILASNPKYWILPAETENGTITRSSRRVEMLDGYYVRITPDEGYAIKEVFINNVSYGDKDYIYKGRVESDQHVRAIFSKEHNVIVEEADNGTIEVSKNKVLDNENVVVIVTPDAGYAVEKILVNGESVGSKYAYNIENVLENQIITAVFVEIPAPAETFDIAVVDSDNGVVTSNKENVQKEEDAAITITPNEGYSIKDVLVNNKSVGAVSNYTISDIEMNYIVSGVFAKEYVAEVEETVNGSVTINENKVFEGENIIVTVNPDEGYIIEDILVNGVSVGNACAYIIENVDSDQTITVKFKEDENTVFYDIKTEQTSNGNIEINKDKVPAGENSSFVVTIEPDAGYGLKELLVNDQPIDLSTGVKSSSRATSGVKWTFVVTGVESETTVKAIFAKQFAVNINPSNNGTVTANNLEPLEEDNVVLTITPNDDYVIKDVKVNDVSVGAVSEYTIENITADQNVVVEFEEAEDLTSILEVASVNIHPNPVVDVVNVDGVTPGSIISVVDLQGKEVKSLKAISSDAKVDLSNLASGVYVIRINGQGSWKVVKQ